MVRMMNNLTLKRGRKKAMIKDQNRYISQPKITTTRTKTALPKSQLSKRKIRLEDKTPSLEILKKAEEMGPRTKQAKAALLLKSEKRLTIIASLVPQAPKRKMER